MITPKTILIIVFLIFYIPGLSFCQIVNIEAERIKENPDGLAGSVSFNFNISKDISKLLILRPAAHLRYKKSNDILLLLADYRLSTVRQNGESESLSNKGFFHVRYNHKFSELIRWEVFTQGQFNKVRKLDFRGLVGTGPRFKFLDTDEIRIYGAPLYMFEYEEEEGNIYHQNHRLSSYLSFSFQPNSSIEMINTTYFQPRLDKLNDYRFVTNMSISIKLTSVLSFDSYFELVHDSKPPVGVIKTSYDFINGLKFAFQPKQKEKK